MKSRILLLKAALMIAAFCLATPVLTQASPADRAILRDKLSFRYVDQPNNGASTYEPMVLDNAGIMAGTESGAFWADQSMRSLQELVRALLCDSARGGDDRLQSYAVGVLQIVNKPVIVYLLKDTNGPITAIAQTNWGACMSPSNRAWPCAINMSFIDDWYQECARRGRIPSPTKRRDVKWAGQMALGAYEAYNRNRQWVLGTFIHELVHTQDRSDDRGHLFWVQNQPFNYGQDGRHFWNEAVPDLASTYKEGIANTLSFLYDNQKMQDTFRWFADNGFVMVEKANASPSAGPGDGPCVAAAPSRDVWLYDQLRNAGAREIASPNPNPYPNYAVFRIRDLPPRFIVYNEMILALVFSQYAQRLGVQRFLSALRAADAQLFRTSTSGSAVLFDTLCRAGLPQGQAPESLLARQVSTAEAKTYLLPLAYADYFTSYRSATKAEFQTIFENRLDQVWIDLYWDRHKDAVRRAAPLTSSSSPHPNGLTTIATALGLTQSATRY